MPIPIVPSFLIVNLDKLFVFNVIVLPVDPKAIPPDTEYDAKSSINPALFVKSPKLAERYAAAPNPPPVY